MSHANYRQPGEVIDYTPAAAVAVGDVIRLGLMQCGIVLAPIAANATGAVGLEGVYELAKNTSDAFSQGHHVWWDPVAKECINTPVTGSLFLGYAFASAIAAATTLYVYLEEFDADPPRLISLAATGNQSIAVADLLCSDLTVLAPNTGAITLALPSVGDIPIGAKLRVRKTTADAQAITLDPYSSETIAGGSSYASIDANGDTALFQSTGAAWVLLDAEIAAGGG